MYIILVGIERKYLNQPENVRKISLHSFATILTAVRFSSNI
jgi:hypothetical protein